MSYILLDGKLANHICLGESCQTLNKSDLTHTWIRKNVGGLGEYYQVGGVALKSYVMLWSLKLAISKTEQSFLNSNKEVRSFKAVLAFQRWEFTSFKELDRCGPGAPTVHCYFTFCGQNQTHR